MEINLIWAQGKDGVIGRNGVMPWHIPEDLAHFKKTTLNFPVIMGRKTWDSLPVKFRPLPGRKNIVITRQQGWGKAFSPERVQRADDTESALQAAFAEVDVEQVWVIGGGQIYAQFLPRASRVVITEIDAIFQGDTYAPKLNNDWQEVSRVPNTSKAGLKFDFVTYIRKSL